MSAAAIGSEQLREVRLYGALGKRFGRVHRLAVRSPREAAQALATVVPGFGAYVLEHNEPGYQVFVGKRGQDQRGEDALDAPLGGKEAICFVPVVAGSKSGLGKIILGAALIGLSFWNPMGLFVGQWAPLAFTGAVGKALVLGGIIQMLSPQQKRGAETRAENTPSYGFDGAVNTSQQGLPVPLGYGRVITGGAVVSAGIDTADLIAPPGTATTIPPKLLPDWMPEYGDSGD